MQKFLSDHKVLMLCVECETCKSNSTREYFGCNDCPRKKIILRSKRKEENEIFLNSTVANKSKTLNELSTIRFQTKKKHSLSLKKVNDSCSILSNRSYYDLPDNEQYNIYEEIRHLKQIDDNEEYNTEDKRSLSATRHAEKPLECLNIQKNRKRKKPLRRRRKISKLPFILISIHKLFDLRKNMILESCVVLNISNPTDYFFKPHIF
ncbi:hypothetical protein WA026_004690 [Henosepilachna vigintioctopunctata]|uniref:Uncharacterized protein n=1 Tax=Henosepilachna vigintioctopunctata TaxID=420089 RepID=A0AAW1V2V6_9CUCU